MNGQHMLTRTEPPHKPPAYLKDKIPSVTAFATALENAVVKEKIGTVFCRAAYSKKYVLPDTLIRAYRFGPPRALSATAGKETNSKRSQDLILR